MFQVNNHLVIQFNSHLYFSAGGDGGDDGLGDRGGDGGGDRLGDRGSDGGTGSGE